MDAAPVVSNNPLHFVLQLLEGHSIVRLRTTSWSERDSFPYIRRNPSWYHIELNLNYVEYWNVITVIILFAKVGDFIGEPFIFTYRWRNGRR